MVAAAVIGTVVGAGTSLVGAHAQKQGAEAAANLQKDQFQTINAQERPFIQSGYGALNRLNTLLGIKSPAQATPASQSSFGPSGYYGGNDFYGFGLPTSGSPLNRIIAQAQGGRMQIPEQGGYPGNASMQSDETDPEFGSLLAPFDANTFNQYKDPGYQFRLQQGTQALRNAAAAGSGALSGAALKDLLGYNQDMASTEYSNAFNRYQTQQGNIFSRLSDIAQLGQTAAAGVGQQGTALAGNAGQALTNAGTAAGGGFVGAGNTLNSGITNAWLLPKLLSG